MLLISFLVTIHYSPLKSFVRFWVFLSFWLLKNVERGITMHGPQYHPGIRAAFSVMSVIFKPFIKMYFVKELFCIFLPLGEAWLWGTKFQIGQGAKWTLLEQHQ